MRYFVTGGAGFIGSNFVRGLLNGLWGNDVDEVTVFDSLTYAGNPANLSSCRSDSRFRFILGDIRDISKLDESIKGHDAVVHFAAESHVDRSISDGGAFLDTNVVGTYNSLRSAARNDVSIFIHVSTDEVYGSLDHGSWNEDCPLLPNSPYSASKASSDLVARSFVQTFGLDVRTTRCSNNFGPFQHPEKLIPSFITRLLRGENVPLYGDGLNVRDWLHVDDHCRGIDKVLTFGRAGEIYNIGGGTEITNIELTKLLLELLGCDESRIEWVPDRAGHDRRYSVDWSKARDVLGYEPMQDLRRDLVDVVNWYRENEDWWSSLYR